MSESSTAEKSKSEFANGAEEIGAVLGKTKSQAYHLLRHKLIKSARKVGNSHIAHIPTLKREFGADASAIEALTKNGGQ